ncbi:MAG: TolC family protein, partial [Smithellaceae bacterium]|nr:TolC family protein [Smithellaceae bacterium]
MRHYFRHIIIAALVLNGCAVGPDFVVPDLKTPGAYTGMPLPPQTAEAKAAGGAAQRFAFAAELPGQWWKLFSSPELDQLIKKGIENSPSLASAQAALSKAEEDLKAAGGSLQYPAVDANLGATRERTSGNVNLGPSSTFNLYNASVGVSYQLDLFGGTRRQLESYAALVDYQRYQYEAAYLTLTANIVTAAIREASLRAQVVTTRDIVADYRRQLDISEKQYNLGAIS